MSVFVWCPVGLRGHKQRERIELLTVTSARNTSCVVITHSSYSGYKFEETPPTAFNLFHKNPADLRAENKEE